MLCFLPLPHQWGSSSRLHDKCHTDARYETYNDLSLAEGTDLCGKPEIATPSSSVQRHIKDRALPPISRIPVLPNYFGNSKSNAFNDILAFDLLRTIAPRGSG
jgi:hypothetical protein